MGQAQATPGDIFAGNFDNSGVGAIEGFTPDGTASLFASLGRQMVPAGLAFDAKGNLYVANVNSDTIVRFTPNGAASVFTNGSAAVFASTGLNTPGSLAFDASGNLYAANSGNNTIEEFTPGGAASVFASTGLNRPLGLAFDANGNLYAVNRGNNTIEEFTPGGVPSVFASTGLGFPGFIAIEPVPTAVPEPASAALLAFGLGALRLVRRRAA